MHEASLAQAALELAVGTARDHGAGRITAITLAVGEMTEADGETLAFWIGVLADGGPAQGVAVKVAAVPAEAACRACGATFRVQPPRWALRCDRCGGAGELRSGRELSVASIEVE